jgi:hypothetical protein
VFFVGFMSREAAASSKRGPLNALTAERCAALVRGVVLDLSRQRLTVLGLSAATAPGVAQAAAAAAGAAGAAEPTPAESLEALRKLGESVEEIDAYSNFIERVDASFLDSFFPRLQRLHLGSCAAAVLRTIVPNSRI